ncbi:MAG: helix-turn-helix domain-containing protein, partial [Candidatus Bathyarchaeota archaeon]|nr:helix-turn-helix domain-containing protein [Candidatus Bathyarchaeota archaeon]
MTIFGRVFGFKAFAECLYYGFRLVLVAGGLTFLGMNHTEALKLTEGSLRDAGFAVSTHCVSRPSCFDFVARKGGAVALFRVPPNLSNACRRDAGELRTISGFFGGAPLLICDKAKDKPLEDDTVYSRYGVFAISPSTLEDVISRKFLPLILAGPGGYYVCLNGDAIRRRRLKLGLSMGKLAESLGVSRRTLYGYEHGMTKASVSAAYKLEWFLGVPVVEPIDILTPAHHRCKLLAIARQVLVRNRLLHRVLKWLRRSRFEVFPTRKAPFDFVAECSDTKLCLIGGVASNSDRNLDARTKEILSISEVVGTRSVFVTDGKQIPDSDIPLVYHEELIKMKNSKDL